MILPQSLVNEPEDTGVGRYWYLFTCKCENRKGALGKE